VREVRSGQRNRSEGGQVRSGQRNRSEGGQVRSEEGE
jgi:hypothetical protein